MEQIIYPSNMEEVIHRPDIVEFKNAITKADCDFIINYWNSLDDWSLSCFYNSYVIAGTKEHTQVGGAALRQFQLKSKDLAEKVFKRDLRFISLSAHRWDPGAFAADHADNAELDGTPNAWEENKLVTMIYLNDNFDGGHLTFRDHGLAFKPEVGSIIVFDVGINNVHAVTEVISGNRYTMLGSYDFADNQYDKDFNSIKEAIKETQEQQKTEWSQGKIMPTDSATKHEPINR